jgi:uncharacterized protein YneR
MGAPDQLSLYNRALLNVGQRFLSALSEEVESRRLLDQVWSDGAIEFCLEQAQWYFAMRAMRLDYDPSITPDFGYRRAFTKPSDWVITSAVSEEEFFRVPLTRYVDESGYWYADLDAIYVRYVSADPSFGGAIASWPKSFYNYVGWYLAGAICDKLTDDGEKIDHVRKQTLKALLDAKNRAAMAMPTMFPAQGSWTRSRQRFLNRRDGGNTSGNIIG